MIFQPLIITITGSIVAYIRILTLEFTRCLNYEKFKGQKENFKEKINESLTFTKSYQFIKKKNQFIFQRNIPDTSCSWETCENAMLMEIAIRKEKKAIQQHHMISSKNTRAIPAMQTALVTDAENALQQKYFQNGMKLLLQKAVQKDH